MVTAIFVYTLVITIVERPEGLLIAAIFIATILFFSVMSRVARSTELRVSHVQVLARICAFLGVRDFNPAPAEITAFEGEPARVSRATALLARWCLRRESREYRQL